MSRELEKPYTGGFIGATHYFALRVYIEDTDLGGVVYHSNYLRFLERARSDLLRSLGINQRDALHTGLGIYAVSDMHIKYRRPARLDDELTILSRLVELRAASCVLDQQIVRGSELIAEAVVTAAFLTPEGRPRRHPPAWRLKFEQIQSFNS
jgi:acyl-CoA thioester hydrolase